jgi:hypothetical protein
MRMRIGRCCAGWHLGSSLRMHTMPAWGLLQCLLVEQYVPLRRAARRWTCC